MTRTEGDGRRTVLTTARTLDELRDELRAEEPNEYGDRTIDWTDLPTFGGEEPACTRSIWSWDESRLLIGDFADELRIVSRREFFERPDEIAPLQSVIDASGLSTRKWAEQVVWRDERTVRRWLAGRAIPATVVKELRRRLME